MTDINKMVASLTLQADEQADWPPARLRARTYLTTTLPALDLVTSVRALVCRGDQIVVVRDPVSVHILPGGKREPDETLLQTLEREVLEETGWTIHSPRLIGLVHFQQLTPWPGDRRYPYPDFLHLVFAADADRYDPERRESDGYELEAGLQPLAAVQAMALSQGERALLRTAIQLSRGPSEASSAANRRRSRTTRAPMRRISSRK
jgi:8-oxo-dGTP pyrophosphatase MutT (NUDIX family)